VRNGLPEEIRKAAEGYGLEIIATIPEDPGLPELEIKGKPVIQLPDDSPLRKGAREILDKFGL
jgi:CO dehydrogenase maturation factor